MNMNIEQLGKQAIKIIKDKWGLPNSGFVAGGSISNIIWELVSNKPAVVNDIDIFYFQGLSNEKTEKSQDSLFRYKEVEDQYYEDYTGMCYRSVTKDHYTITESIKEDILNIVKYKSNTEKPELILRSFDINCTKIGYSIEEDKVYWTKEFEEFLQTGELKVCNLMTPSHTAIRITKKKDELDAKLDEFEFKLLQHAVDYKFNDVIKLRFKERYLDIFNQYSTELEKYFEIDRDLEAEEYVLSHHKKETQLYRLISKNPERDIKDQFERHLIRGVFNEENIQRIHNSITFLFYMRNIYNKPELETIWSKLDYFYSDVDYIDKEVSVEDIELLQRFAKYAPNSIENLKGLKISQQINLINKFLEKFKDDPIIAISILEKYKFTEDVDLDDYTTLLLELSVRRSIVNDTRGKVKSIVGDVGTGDVSNDDIIF
jgi:hypothetical protein